MTSSAEGEIREVLELLERDERVRRDELELMLERARGRQRRPRLQAALERRRHLVEVGGILPHARVARPWLGVEADLEDGAVARVGPDDLLVVRAVDAERDDVVLRVQRADPDHDERRERRKSDEEVSAHAGARGGVAGPVVHRVDDHEVRDEEEEAVRLRVVRQPAEHSREQSGPSSRRIVPPEEEAK